MAQEYDNTNKGILSINAEKGTAPNSASWPDFKGSINIEGKEYWLSGWEKTAQRGQNAGKTFLSLSVKPKEAAPAPYAAPASQRPAFRRDPAPAPALEAVRQQQANADQDEALPF